MQNSAKGYSPKAEDTNSEGDEIYDLEENLVDELNEQINK
jgi:hypothetical protein